MKPRLLDLFCGQGGATRGYQEAGFHVTGVDSRPQPQYCGDAFVLTDALDFDPDGFDAIHASPPCQRYSVAANRWKNAEDHPDLVAPVREMLAASGRPYVIENVPGAPLVNPIMLCGSSFGLAVRRHRLFDVPMFSTPCAHHLQRDRRYPQLRSGRTTLATVVGVFGHGGGPAKDTALWGDAMGIDWMTKRGLSQAIPPAYTRYVGGYLIHALAAMAS